MAGKPPPVVLDSWSILAYFEDEPTGEKVAEIIAAAHETKTPVMMSVVNVAEVWYIIARESSPADADRSVSDMGQLGIEFVDVDWKLAREAAEFKSQHKMSLADCFAASLAKQRRAELVTGDREFKQVERDIKIRML